MRYKLIIAMMLIFNFSFAQDDSLNVEKLKRYYSGFQSYFYIHGYTMVDTLGNVFTYSEYNPYSIEDSINAKDWYEDAKDSVYNKSENTYYGFDFFEDINPNVDGEIPLLPRVGIHSFSLDRISTKKPGFVKIKKINSSQFQINGNHNDGHGNYVCIDGFLKPLKKGTMKFTGDITVRLSVNKCDDEVVRKGEFTFLCIPGRNFWRLQEADLCEERRIDYLDVFF